MGCECERPIVATRGAAQAFVAATTRIAFGIASWRRPLRARRPTCGSSAAPRRTSSRGLPPRPVPSDAQRVGEGGDADERVLRVEVDERQAAAALGLDLQLVEAEDQQAAFERQAGDPVRGRRRASTAAAASRRLRARGRPCRRAAATPGRRRARAGRSRRCRRAAASRRRAGEVVHRLRAAARARSAR